MQKDRIQITILWVILFFLLWYFDLAPKFAELKELHNKEKVLTKELRAKAPPAQLTKNYSLADEMRKPNEILQDLLHILQMNHYNLQTLQSIAVPNFAGIKILDLQFSLSGQLEDLEKLFLLLFQYPSPIVIKQFSFDISDQFKLNLKMEILIFNIHSKLSQHHLKKFSCPALFDIPFKQIKFVGFLKSNTEKQGIIRLPNSKTYTVQLNTVMAKEQARIVNVSPYAITAIIHNKKVFLKRE